MKKTLLLALVLLFVVPAALRAQTVEEAARADDRAAIKQAILDYAEGLYTVDPSRIERSVHPELAKVGFWRPSADTWYRTTRQDYDEMIKLAKTWNEDGHVDAKTAPRDIVLLDMIDQTASARLVAEWGIDYLHLAKIKGRWMIMNVLWQTRPEGYAKGGAVRRVVTQGQ